MLPSIPDSNDAPTQLVPHVPIPPPAPPSRSRAWLPWAGFGLVAVVVVAGTTAWSATLRAPEAPLLVNAAPPVSVARLPVAAAVIEPIPTTTVAPTRVVRKVVPVRTRAPVVTPETTSLPPTVDPTPPPTTEPAPITTKACKKKTCAAPTPTTDPQPPTGAVPQP